MTLPASDVFTAANNTALTTYSSNWTLNVGDFWVQSNAIAANGSSTGETGAHWNADAFNADQYAQGVVTIGGANHGIGVAVRCSASGATYYGFYSDSSASYLFKNVGGNWTQLGSNGTAWSTGNTVRLEVSGTTITPKVNGATSGIGAQTNSDIASGSGGLSGWADAGTANRLDTWEAGNLTAAGAMTGTASGVATQSGAMTGAGVLTGTSAGVTTQSATASGAISTTGSATGTATQSGALSGSGALIGASSGATTQSGALTGDGTLTGVSAGIATQSGAMVGSGVLIGSASGVASQTGDLTGLGSGAMVGAAAGVATTSAGMIGAGVLLGSTAGSSSQTGILTAAGTTGDLVGSSDGVATYVAILTADGLLYGGAIASATADATLTADGVLIGSVTGTGSVVGYMFDSSFRASGTRTVYTPRARETIEADHYGDIQASGNRTIDARG